MFNQFDLISSDVTVRASLIGGSNARLCRKRGQPFYGETNAKGLSPFATGPRIDFCRLFLRTSIFAIWLVGLSMSVGSAVAQEFRSFDGSGNNLSNSNWGSHGSVLGRLTAPNYANGVDSLPASLPNPRVISNRVFNQTASIPDARGLSEWVWLWGQFIDHDISHTLLSNSAGVIQIPIPEDDPVFGDLPPGSSIQMTRAMFESGTGQPGPPAIPREHANNLTPWLDGGMVYGDRFIDGPTGVVRSEWLRDPLDTAKLRVSDGGALGDLMPKYIHGSSPEMANTNTPGMTGSVQGDKAYVAGDVRANENPGLLMLHTVFVREHNRLVDVIRAVNPDLANQELYDQARKLVGAQIQAITYNEFLPSLGVNLSGYQGYDGNLEPIVFSEFSNAAFRTAHSQINSQQLRLDQHGNPIPEGHISLSESFFNPDKLLEGGLEPLIRGFARQVQEANDIHMVDELRNQLFSIFVPGVGLVPNATDLASIDIARGRDCGLAPLNEVRLALGLNPYISFLDISSDVDLANDLADLYGNIDDIDLFVGLLAEDHLLGTSMGETSIALFELQFSLLRDSDRFWFQNELDGINSDLLLMGDWNGQGDLSAIDWLNNLQLSDILHLNTSARVQANVFFAVPEPSTGMALMLIAAVIMPFVRRRE